MEMCKVIHLEEANTLASFLTPEERQNIVSLKITGVIGRKDFDYVLDDMCEVYGLYDKDDTYTPDYELAAAIRHLDLGEATYVDGEELPYFGYRTQLETLILPQGIITTIDRGERDTGISESEKLKTLVLPEGLKTVGGFNSCINLTGLLLPEGLEVIKPFAFSGCESITAIRIPASIKSISGSSFAGCNIAAYEIDEKNPYYTVIDGVLYSKDLKTLVAFPSAYNRKYFVIPETTKIIGHSAFMDAKAEKVVLPQGLTTIEGRAFEGSSVRSMEMPDSVTKLGKLVFRFCFQLEHIRLSDRLSIIPEQTFSRCLQLKRLEIPKSVKRIYYSAIAWSDGLESLKLNDGLEEIVDEGPMLGVNGDLRELNLPKTLKKVPGGVFNYSPYIKEFNLDPDNPYFSTIDGALCSKDGKTLYSVPNVNRCSYEVPEGIEVIGERALSFLPSLLTVELPSTLRTIGCRTFQGCDSLTCIKIPAGVTKVDIYSLWADNLKTVIMRCAIPPKMTGIVNDDKWIYRDVDLLVPRDSVALYMQASGWKCFRVKEFKE